MKRLLLDVITNKRQKWMKGGALENASVEDSVEFVAVFIVSCAFA